MTVEIRPALPTPGSSGPSIEQHGLVQGTTYAFPLPVGQAGTVDVNSEGGAPFLGGDGNWVSYLSKKAGDEATAKAMGATTNPKDGSVNTPYWADRGSLGWSVGGPLPSIDKDQWYFNIRIVSPTVPGKCDTLYVQMPITQTK